MAPSASDDLILSLASEVIPRKLVEKIKSGQFVDIRELLKDNIALLSRLEAVQSTTAAILHTSTLGSVKPRLLITPYLVPLIT